MRCLGCGADGTTLCDDCVKHARQKARRDCIEALNEILRDCDADIRRKASAELREWHNGV